MDSELDTTDEILSEIHDVIAYAAEKERRDNLTGDELEYIAGLCNRMVKETKIQMAEIEHLSPEEIPKQNGGSQFE